MDLFSKLKKKPKKREYKENIDFVFIDAPDDQLTLVKIISGDYSGIIFHFGKVSVDLNGEQPRLKYEYTIVDYASKDQKELTSDEVFFTMLGDILVSIIENNLGEVDAPSRTDDIEEFDS
jgi:hypothetical protein